MSGRTERCGDVEVEAMGFIDQARARMLLQRVADRYTGQAEPL